MCYVTDGNLVELPPAPGPVIAEGSDEDKGSSTSSCNIGRQYIQEEDEEEDEGEEEEEDEEEEKEEVKDGEEEEKEEEKEEKKKRQQEIDDARLPLKKRQCHVDMKCDRLVAASMLLGLKMQG